MLMRLLGRDELRPHNDRRRRRAVSYQMVIALPVIKLVN